MMKFTKRALLAAAASLPLMAGSAWAEGLISIIVTDPANPYWFTEGEVAKATAEELGYEATVAAHKGDTNTESNLIDAAITNGAKAIILDPANADGSVGVVRKATEAAKRGMIRVPLREGRTLHHDMQGRHGAGKVVMRTAPAGTGIIAGGPMRAVFEMLGIQDVVAKSTGSQNPYNMIRATLDALTKESSPRMVAQRRGKKVADILKKPEDAPAEEAAEA